MTHLVDLRQQFLANILERSYTATILLPILH